MKFLTMTARMQNVLPFIARWDQDTSRCKPCKPQRYARPVATDDSNHDAPARRGNAPRPACLGLVRLHVRHDGEKLDVTEGKAAGLLQIELLPYLPSGRIERTRKLTAVIERFFSQFDQLTGRVTGSRQQDFARNLRSWLTSIDSAPAPIGDEAARLSALQSWDDVQRDVMRPPRGMAGSGQLNWADDDDLRPAGQIALFRRLASEELDAMNFAFDYFFTGDNNITRTIQEVSDQLFRPLSEDLRLRFEAIADAAEEADEGGIPAADRVVTLDHNSQGYNEALGKIEFVEEALRASNAIPPDEKAMLQAEIASGKAILAAPRSRLAAIKEVLINPLTWLAVTFASGLLGELAGSALHAVAALIGIPF